MKETTFIPAPPVKIQPLTQRKAWSALTAHFNQVRDLHLRDLSAQDPKRDERMTLEAVGLYLDYSKKRITDETLQLLFQLATQSGLKERIEAMFCGVLLIGELPVKLTHQFTSEPNN